MSGKRRKKQSWYSRIARGTLDARREFQRGFKMNPYKRALAAQSIAVPVVTGYSPPRIRRKLKFDSPGSVGTDMSLESWESPPGAAPVPTAVLVDNPDHSPIRGNLNSLQYSPMDVDSPYRGEHKSGFRGFGLPPPYTPRNPPPNPMNIHPDWIGQPDLGQRRNPPPAPDPGGGDPVIGPRAFDPAVDENWTTFQPQYKYRRATQRISTGAARQRYGLTFRTATPAQQRARIDDHYTGYGDFWQRRKRRRAFYKNPYSRRRRSKRRRYRRRFYPGGGSYGSRLYRGTGSFWSRLGLIAKKGLADCVGGAASGLATSLAGGQGMISTNNIINAGTGHDGLGPIVRFSGPTETGDLLLSHTEFVSQIYAAPDSQFLQQHFDINVGLESTFKWLSSIAANYHEYELIQCAFTFKPTISNFITQSGVVGTVGMAVQYNVDEEAFSSWDVLMGDVSSVSSKLTEGMAAGIECDATKVPGNSTNKFVRTGGLSPDKNIRNYDMAKLTFAQVNVNPDLANQAIGELWVSYTVRLRRPCMRDVEGQAGTRSLFCSVQTPTNAALTQIPGTAPGSGIQGQCFDTSGPSFTQCVNNMFDADISTDIFGPRTTNFGLPAAVPGGVTEITYYGDPGVPLDGRIPCAMTPGYTLNAQDCDQRATTITFPAQMGGIFVLNMIVTIAPGQAALVPGTNCFVGMTRIYVNTDGNVTPIKDMLHPQHEHPVTPANAQAQWTSGSISYQSASNPTDNFGTATRASTTMQLTFHFKVEPLTQSAAGATVTNNQIHVVGDYYSDAAFGGSAAAQMQLGTSMISISEYNHFDHDAVLNQAPQLEYVSNGTIYNP